MRLSVTLTLVVLTVCVVVIDAKRFGGGGGKRRPSGGSRPKPAPAPRPRPAEQHDFLNAERGHSTSHNSKPSAPQQPNPQGNRPIGFEHFGNGNTHGSSPIGFDKVNSQVQNKPGGSFTPSAPHYPGFGGSGSHPGPPPVYHPQAQSSHYGSSVSSSSSNLGPPPAYHPPGQSQAPHYGGMDHPPAYPGRPVNAPPAYTPNQPSPHYGQNFGNPPQQGQHGFPFQGQGYHGQQNYGNSFGSSYPQQSSFGNYGQGYHPSYPTQSYGGSPFGNSGYNGNPYYSPNNFGYSNNPGYFGQGYQGQYNDHKKSRFGGLPIPIPIPIPIGGFGGGYGSGFGGGGHGGYGGGPSYNHRLLDTFIKGKEEQSATGNSTSIFVLNNSTVTPCTTDHFSFGKLNMTVVSCTAEFCTGVKLTTATKVRDVESRHSAWLTMCLEKNETWSAGGDKVQPSVSELYREVVGVCRNETANTTQANITETATTAAPETNTTKICEDVHCSWVEMCMTAIEIVDECPGAGSPCPFRRSGYRPCVTIKMCRAANTPLSTFATLNTTLYTADEYDHRKSQHHANNLTLISYHPPVIVFNPNCSQNASGPGCSPPPAPQCPAGSTLVSNPNPAGGNTTSCSPVSTPGTDSSTVTVTTVTDAPGGASAPADTSTPPPPPSS